MQNTTNYGFKKYESGDLFNPLTTNNFNAELIDTELKAVSDLTVSPATELVSQGVHAITILDTDAKVFRFVATANFTAGETFTVNGVQVNCYTPSGASLGTGSYITGAVVIGSLNADNSAITLYVPEGAVVTASDSERLGGELPSYYAKESDMTNAESSITSLTGFAGRKALVNTYYDSSTKKLYEVNADGTQGGEISMGSQKVMFFFATTNTADIDISGLDDNDYIYIAVRYSTGYNSEKVKVSTAKAWSSHQIIAASNQGVSISYSNGKLSFVRTGSYNVEVSMVFC